MHYFYSPDIAQPFVTLSNEESEHCVRVMRHREGDAVRVTDGCGHLAEAVMPVADFTTTYRQPSYPQWIASRRGTHQERRPHGVAVGESYRNRHLLADVPAMRPLRAHAPQFGTSATVGHRRAETVANHLVATAQDDEIHGFHSAKH